MNNKILNAISISTILLIGGLSQAHAEDFTYRPPSSIDKQHQIEAIRKSVDSVGFIDLDAQSRYELLVKKDNNRLKLLNTVPQEKRNTNPPGVIIF
jgi:hypothetical protein